ncbi:MAG: response regulator [Candidatus Obscuribacter sp.]|nr:response regulator [Candidatus Obscuribacter sp.]
MTKTAIPQIIEPEVTRRTDALFLEMKDTVYKSTDKLFGMLLVCEWIAGLVTALLISPRAWSGTHSDIHIHVWTAFILGALILGRPVYLVHRDAGAAQTRQAVAIGQMLWAALLIHLTGGRIESHFLIFGSLAFLSFYRDKSVLIAASAVVVIDHILRGIFFPLSIYGVEIIEPWRWLEHTWWVVFEDFFLFKLIDQNIREMHEIADKQVELVETQKSIEALVELKTRQLKESQLRTSAEYKVAAVLSKAKNLSEAAPQILTAVVEGLAQQARYSIVIKEYESRRSLGAEPPRAQVQTDTEDQLKTLRFFCRSNMENPSGTSDDLMLCCSHPVKSKMKGTLLASLEIYTESGIELDDADSQMLTSIAGQLADFVEKRGTESENAHLAYLVQSSGDAIIGVNPDGTLSSWNSAAEQLFGYSAESLFCFPYTELIPEHRRVEQQKLLEQSLRGLQHSSLDTEILNKNGNAIDVSITMAPVLDENQHILGCSVNLREITDRKLAEKRVAEFYSIVSHELRTPLTSIRAVLGLMEGDIVEPGSTEGKELLQVARSSADRLIRLINDMLDLKKIEAGKMDMEIEPHESRELVESCLRALDGVAEEASVTLLAEHEVEGAIMADLDKTTQVLTNLVSNAIKFSPAGETVRVKVSGGKTQSNSKSDGEMLRFSVIDRGPGISDRDKELLFEKFQQIDASDSREKGGTGLGLAISKALVDCQKGEIGVESTPGQGSCFWFQMPLAPGTEVPSSKREFPHLATEQAPRTVLLVEDDQELALVLTQCLTSAGYRVEQAYNLAQARNCLKAPAPSIILLDIRLPDGNGLSLIEEIKGDERNKEIPIIIISGESAPDNGHLVGARGSKTSTASRAAIQKGSARVLDWLRKPFTEAELTRAVLRATRPARGKRILVVDDDPGLCRVIETQLTALGLDCVIANDGISALRLAKDEHPDLIILDVNLPKLNAFEILGALKESERKATPLIIYTGQDLSREQKQDLTLGLTRHLCKRSAGQEDLLQAVESLLSEIAPESPSN